MKSEFVHDASDCPGREMGGETRRPVLFLPEKHETWLISDMSDATAAGATVMTTFLPDRILFTALT